MKYIKLFEDIEWKFEDEEVDDSFEKIRNTFYWISINKNKILLKNLTDRHLKNIIKYIIKNKFKYKKRSKYLLDIFNKELEYRNINEDVNFDEWYDDEIDLKDNLTE
jgi:hypothetical protein